MCKIYIHKIFYVYIYIIHGIAFNGNPKILNVFAFHQKPLINTLLGTSSVWISSNIEIVFIKIH